MTTHIKVVDLNETGKEKLRKAEGVDSLEELNPEVYTVAVYEE